MLRKLAGQSAIYGISSIVARLLNYLLTPYLTRIMTPAEYGVVTDMYALIPFALVILTLGLETGYFRFAGRAENEAEKKRIFSTAWGAVTCLSLGFMAVTLLWRNPIAAAAGGIYVANPSFITIVAGIIALDVVTAIPFARLREQGRAARFVVVRVVSVVVNVVLCLFFYSVLPHLAANSGLFAAIWNPGFGAGYVFVANFIASHIALFLLLPSCRGMLRIDGKVLRTMLLYSLPLLVSGIAGTANEFIDRQMIKFLMPADVAMGALGIYGAVVKIGVILLLFTQMYRLAAEPFFLASFKKEDFLRTNAEALKYFVIVSVGIFLVITLFTDIFALILGRDFREGVFILPVVLLANIFAGIVLNLSFWYKQSGATRFAIYITCTGLAVTVAANFVLVPRFGYAGAAWARLLCEAAMVAISYGFNRKYFPIPYNLRRIGGYFLLGGVFYVCGFLTAELPVAAKYCVNLILVSLFLLYAVRRERIDVAGVFKSMIKKR